MKFIERNRKKISTVLGIAFFVCIFVATTILVIGLMTDINQDIVNETEIIEDTNEKAYEYYQEKTEKENNKATDEKYIKKIEWGNLTNYCCAVEIDEYDGDVLESGTYRIYPDLVSGLDKGRIAIVWDVYTSQNLYSNISELNKSEYRGSVGGITKNELTLDLSSGQYLYIKYNPVANNNPTGIIVINKK